MAVTVLPEDTAEALARVSGGRQAFTSTNDITWQRPTDWVAMPDVAPTDNKFVGLLAITNDDSNFIALNAAGNYTVDWGDGSATENINSGTQANHQYTYSSISSSTNCSRGYRQVLVTVTPQSGATFTTINLQVKNSKTNLNEHDAKWLDIVIAGGSLTTITVGASSETVRLRWLERAAILSSAKTSWANQFQNCYQLRSVSVASSGTVTSTANMFTDCRALRTVPLFNTASVTSMASMFLDCPSLERVPLFNTASVTSMASMFQRCRALRAVPLFNTATVTSMSNMFNGCSSLRAVPLFNTASVTSMASMFVDCLGLEEVPLFNTASVTSTNAMFSGCHSLRAVPLFNTAAVTASMGSMFSDCRSLQSVPQLSTASVPSMGSMFSGCVSLQSIGLMNTSGLTGAPSSIFSNCTSLAIGATSGIKYAVSYASCQLSKDALESIFDNLGKADGAQTVTITTNWGAPSAISKTSSGTTSGSTTVTIANTSSLEAGMEISGTGISDAVAVTFQDTGDTVTRTAHGIPNDTPVSFATVVTTTGISTYTRYYVVNATADTFQVSDTVGGSAKALTTNGSGTCLYGTTITAINANTDVTLSIPASATGSVTTSSALLKRSKARLKGWTVSP